MCTYPQWPLIILAVDVDVKNRYRRWRALMRLSCLFVVTLGCPGLGRSFVLPVSWNLADSRIIVDGWQLNWRATCRMVIPSLSMSIAWFRWSSESRGIIMKWPFSNLKCFSSRPIIRLSCTFLSNNNISSLSSTCKLFIFSTLDHMIHTLGGMEKNNNMLNEGRERRKYVYQKIKLFNHLIAKIWSIKNVAFLKCMYKDSLMKCRSRFLITTFLFVTRKAWTLYKLLSFANLLW